MYRGFDFTGYSAPFVGGISDSTKQDVTGLKQEYAAVRDKDTLLKMEAAKLKVLEGDNYLKNSVLAEYDSDIKNLAKETVSGRIPYEMAGTLVSQGAAKIFGNENILRAVESRANYDKAQEMKLQLGPLALDFANVKPTEWNTEKMGVYTPAVEQEMNWRGAVQDIFKVLPTSYNVDITKLTPQQLDDAIQGSKRVVTGFSGVNSAMVRKAINDRFNVYINSPEGNQRFRKLTLIDKMSEEDAKAFMKKEAVALASSQVSENYSYAESDRLQQLRESKTGGGSGGLFIGTPKAAFNLPDTPDIIIQNGKEAIKSGDVHKIAQNADALFLALKEYDTSDKNLKISRDALLKLFEEVKQINKDAANILLVKAADADAAYVPFINSSFTDVSNLKSELAALKYSPDDINNIVNKLEKSKLLNKLDKRVQPNALIEALPFGSVFYGSKPGAYSVFKDIKNKAMNQMVGQGVTFYGVDPTRSKEGEFTAFKNAFSTSAPTYREGFVITNMAAGTEMDELDLDIPIDPEYVDISDRPVLGKGYLLRTRVPKKKSNNTDPKEYVTVYMSPKQSSTDGNRVVDMLASRVVPGYANNPRANILKESIARSNSSLGGDANTTSYTDANKSYPYLQPVIDRRFKPLTTGNFAYYPDGENGFVLKNNNGKPSSVGQVIDDYYHDENVQESLIRSNKTVKDAIFAAKAQYLIAEGLLPQLSHPMFEGDFSKFKEYAEKVMSREDLYKKTHISNVPSFIYLLNPQ